MVAEQNLLDRIEKFIAAVPGMTHWSFGREALNDTNLVDDLRAGRELRRGTRLKVEEYMDRRAQEISAAVASLSVTAGTSGETQAPGTVS